MKSKEKGKSKEERRKTKKKVWRIVAVVIGAYAMINLLITLIFSGRIPHRFASVEEGRELMLSNSAYYDNFTQNDIDFRMQKTGATMDELLEASAASVKKYSFFEKWYLNSRVARIALKSMIKGYDFPKAEEIVFIKADMSMESGASGYTHGTQIYLNSMEVTFYAVLNFIPGFSKYFDKVLCHEFFHCLSRCNPDFRAEMYSLIHFTITDKEYELPPCVIDNFLSNPDVEHHDSYATFIIDGQPTDCFETWISTSNLADAQGGFMSNDDIALVPVDGQDIYYTREQASNFDDVFGTNTNYVIDPEECMADNFSFAVLYGLKGKDGNGYPNPEIIQGIIDYLKR